MRAYAGPGAALLPAPSDSGWRSSKHDLPSIVVKTGVPVCSASRRRASLAPDISTPAPAQIMGRSAASRARAASAISAAAGCDRALRGDV